MTASTQAVEAADLQEFENWVKTVWRPDDGGDLLAKEFPRFAFAAFKAGREVAAPELMARFCPGCGSVGPVPDTYRDCCPDGGRARVIPAKLAEQCHDLFQCAITAASRDQVNSAACGGGGVQVPDGWKLVPTDRTVDRTAWDKMVLAVRPAMTHDGYNENADIAAGKAWNGNVSHLVRSIIAAVPTATKAQESGK